jgi:hypothetical protein
LPCGNPLAGSLIIFSKFSTMLIDSPVHLCWKLFKLFLDL